ncbi:MULTISPECIES: heavy metal-responsive transcriptional regulator [unclassified Tolypothrix]|uniref:heavy metal-responsive transcriptional regulator n=1 Tax=unclassified Tolypothrix TaxID=2649714 RepID=UPI0005EAA218|nr:MULTISPECIES: heavy metal-responsive transcriptional regulator [unclassified Tolypothrix]BAY89532.1 transcriptional regulator [Microchaete diplosiphon NIES-3275]EKF02503.1 transcriptional regulator [Tolypothrix sp. PCC 7601]MBE9081562.1 heavy metal-responsive transcriptional regulator [Tolypothrix sp. LEGE 11397]UYD23816.1 heavy metal-responsive transcriptional regulator [Tolypothrix sp. PCC 7712]UYD33959.1 heavy metal-responsive transcriptional regulator [Tolypothrix sp. PCC 7601]
MLAQAEGKQIGVVAKESGVPIKTIRYYEELGLLQSSGRTEGGFRLFSADVLARLHFIKRAQSLGLSLSEIKEFLNVHDSGNLPCEHIKIKLEQKVKAIDEQIQQLMILRQELSGLLSGWEIKPDNNQETICPIIEHQ